MTVTFELDQRTIVRVNYDTIYTFALLDLTEPVTLVMPETDGRYQSAWLITEEHYNPYAITEPGRYEITEENTGSKYLLLGMRTLVNMNDEEDVAKANDLVDQLEIIQASPGSYDPVEEYQQEKDDKPYEAKLNTPEMEQADPDCQDKVGGNRIMDLLKELETARKEREIDPIDGLKPGESKDIGDKENAKSIIGS